MSSSDLKDLESLDQLVDRASEYHTMLTRLVLGASGQFVVTDANGILAVVTASGDVTLAAGGAVTIGASAITTGKINALAVSTAKIAASGVTAPKLEEGVQRITDITITSAELLALNATPITVIAAPGADKAVIFEGAVLHKPTGTAYAGVAAGEDLAVKYTDASGLEVAQCEVTGFLDQTTVQTRYCQVHHAASGASQITPVANAALVLHLLVGEIITGDTDLLLRIYHRVVPTVLS